MQEASVNDRKLIKWMNGNVADARNRGEDKGKNGGFQEVEKRREAL